MMSHIHMHLPNRFWAEAIATASYIRNRSSTSAVEEGKTPYEKWHGRRPNLEHLRVFGCAGYAHIPDCNRKKLDNKAEKLRFVGYSTNSKGYRLYSEHRNKMLMRRDVTFDERNFLLGPEPGRLDVLFPVDIDSPEVEVEEAAEEWKNAVESEYQSLMENDTWDLMELPEGRQAVGSMWVFKVKHDSCGRVERFKGRLVVKGYSQKYGVDFEETFAHQLFVSHLSERYWPLQLITI